MAVKTNTGLVEYAKAQLGKPYWFGTFGQTANKDLLYNKRKQYKGTQNEKYYNQANYKVKFTDQYGKRVHDCAGLIKGYLFSDTPTSKPVYKPSLDWGSETMLHKCTKSGKIETIPEIPGVLVFYTGHVGVYIGNGYVIEAKGHDYGVVKTALKGRGWTHWGMHPSIEYTNTEKPVQQIKPVVPKAGQALNLKNVKLFAASMSSIPIKTVSGTYYLYDGKLVNGKYRITNKPSNVGKKPVVLFVTGWVDKNVI